jgi:VCBS repeat protein/ASPIC/UnbV protein
VKRFIYPVIITLFILSCQNQKTDTSETIKNQNISGTEQMIDSINVIIARTNFRHHIYESGEKVKLVAQEVKNAKANNSLQPQLYIEYGQALLNAGQTEEALDIFNEILEKLPENKQIVQQTKGLHEGIAISYLRLGEQRNCIENHNNETCLFPIKGKGIHTDQAGSKAAIEKYKEILAVFPDDLRTRWLLNLAYMTIGEYPKSVPVAFLIPPSLFTSEYPLPKFENISSNLGIDVTDLAGGIILDDFNNDGWTDIIASSWGMFGQIKIFMNDLKGGFVEKTENSGLKGLVGGLNLIQADYDNDGYLDFYVIRGAWSGFKWMGLLPNSLIKNNGDGTFTDVTIAAGMYNAYPTQSAVWFDFNTDGNLDLFVGNETHTQEEIHPSQLFLNNGDGTFTDVAPQLGIDIKAYIKGVAAGDINNDNLPDIYISIISGENKLLLNKGGSNISDWQFEEVAKQWHVEEPLESFPTWFFDYNNDGFEDIFVTSFDKYSLYQQSREVAADYLGQKSNSDWPRLYINREGKSFQNITKQVGLQRIIPTMGCNYGDLDNDGWLDFYLGTGAPDFRAVVPNRMFRNNNGKIFQDVTYAGNFGHIQKGHGIGFADLDNDGDQDIYAVMGGSVSGDVSQNVLFENPGSENQWLNVHLIGQSSNRSAIGAKIRLTVKKDNDSIQQIYNTVSSGGSFGSNSLNQEIGLGQVKAVLSLAINWPNGDPTYIDYGPVNTNRFIQIQENEKAIQYLDVSPIPFNKTEKKHQHHH